jgi:hypothetical protein
MKALIEGGEVVEPLRERILGRVTSRTWCIRRTRKP